MTLRICYRKPKTERENLYRKPFFGLYLRNVPLCVDRLASFIHGSSGQNIVCYRILSSLLLTYGRQLMFTAGIYRTNSYSASHDN